MSPFNFCVKWLRMFKNVIIKNQRCVIKNKKKWSINFWKVGSGNSIHLLQEKPILMVKPGLQCGKLPYLILMLPILLATYATLNKALWNNNNCICLTQRDSITIRWKCIKSFIVLWCYFILLKNYLMESKFLLWDRQGSSHNRKMTRLRI